MLQCVVTCTTDSFGARHAGGRRAHNTVVPTTFNTILRTCSVKRRCSLYTLEACHYFHYTKRTVPPQHRAGARGGGVLCGKELVHEVQKFVECDVVLVGLQCVAVCCSVLQCVAVCCSVLHCVAACCIVLQTVAVCCSVLQCVAVCQKIDEYDVVLVGLQCVAVRCRVLRCVAQRCSVIHFLQTVVMCCSVLQYVKNSRM